MGELCRLKSGYISGMTRREETVNTLGYKRAERLTLGI